MKKISPLFVVSLLIFLTALPFVCYTLYCGYAQVLFNIPTDSNRFACACVFTVGLVSLGIVTLMAARDEYD